MNFGFAQQVLNIDYLFGLLSIVVINIILSGDNAVVIAMAVRALPKKQRRQGILLGTLAAVLLRIGLTFFAAKLLDLSFLKLMGGIMIAWLAVKLFLDSDAEGGNQRQVKAIGRAINAYNADRCKPSTRTAGL